MPGQGKYSNYADTLSTEDNARIGFLGKVFSGSPSLAMKDVIARAKAYLVPAKQTGADTLQFPSGEVDLNYTASPDISAVAWGKAGDPSTPYTPDVRSPGSSVPLDQLGNTDTTSISTNLSPKDNKPDDLDFKPNYTPGQVGSGTRSPANAVGFVTDKNEAGLGGALPASTNADTSGGEIYKP